jgi:hypothetical protein
MILMNTRLATAISLSIILCVGFVGQAFAQVIVPGVVPNDTFRYEVKTHFSSDNTSATVPAGLIDYNNTSQFKVVISSVSGVNATATYIWDFVNGTEIPFLLTQDVFSGLSYYKSFSVPPIEILVGANIVSGGLLHPGGNDTITVNQTISRNYASGERETNVIEFTDPIVNSETDNTTVGMSTDTYYIDKATGVLVEQDSKIEHYVNPAESQSLVWKLKETNSWNASAPLAVSLTISLVLAAVSVAVIALVAVYVLRRKRNRKKSRR